jgi:polyisoprenoid-binding protein YceI
MKPGVYSIDPSRSKIRFGVINLLVIPVKGQFDRFEGRIRIAPRFEESSADVTIDLHSINTDWKGRDEHLRNEDFFDVERFPKMSFASTSVSGTPDGFVLKGILDLHGYKREVTLDARELPDGTLEAKGQLNRKEFGLTAGPSIKNRVDLDLLVALQIQS